MSADSELPRPVLLAEYRPPFFLLDEVNLQVELFADHALVRSSLCLRRNPAVDDAEMLVLDGEELELLELRLDGQALPPERYRLEGVGNRGRLVIPTPPVQCTLETVSRIYPAANTALEGLYRSGSMFCTQCEPEGFRRITWYPDRPDVLAPFTVTISADRQTCPVLLAGGNPVGRGELPEGRHWASFKDPFPKPSYLFALVAGDLVGVHDRFTTASGRQVALAIYVEAHNRDKCDHAMAALKKAMRWDEETFGLEYDLDHYLIVAVDDFTMGAMENKGLNIFNARYVLARPESATDDDFENIEAVIAHEYFHNWTGNRVTCRDWFQLSLKEGLTVFRDQLFSQQLHSAGVKRINDVRLLREQQFVEDAGPLAHPVRPESYLEINNFYTLTVYEKGAELVRMLHTLLGPAGFRAGLRLYLSRHDGSAATIEDFLAAMAEAGGRELGAFARWYARAGTPRLQITDDYDPAAGCYRLRVVQEMPVPATTGGECCDNAQGVAEAPPASEGRPEQPRPVAEGRENLPLLLPLAVGLLSPAGEEVAAELLESTEWEQVFEFTGLHARPVPSLLRGFSAPVRLTYDYRDEQLGLLLAHDTDPFCRWEAGQRLSGSLILELAGRWQAREYLQLPGGFVDTYRQLLARLPGLEDKSFAALLVALPTEEYLAEQMALIDVEALHTAREFVRRELAVALRPRWEEIYRSFPVATEGEGTYDPRLAGGRRLRNQALFFLLALADDRELIALARQQFFQAGNMTDSLAALRGLVHAAAVSEQPHRIFGRSARLTYLGYAAPVCLPEPAARLNAYGPLERQFSTPDERLPAARAVAAEALEEFAARWGHDPLVLDKWFTVQATAPSPDTLERVEALMAHPAFRLSNPNRVRALIGAFAAANPVAFHRADGAGYRFLAAQIMALDSVNPQVAARLAARFSRWRRFAGPRRELMRAELEKIATAPKLSRDVYEMVSKSLGSQA
ncbi:aminopeptidase N [Desulfurivibrio alkaliphilus]|uniref:Aminopeptidase N n=1 Tax=Desulfurivibrio alkaliphilus (strain DSM 19089 / UNIQEM U267 / AHT2) TaxID=589865 RepID=D6Z6L6_DESAT|nr:aminopeptidase N [Desulfurivibrio alkaliphilus]ADH84975.1 aminopeptidase N [Desulfurivibrio alkaliphilus AHT 2]